MDEKLSSTNLSFQELDSSPRTEFRSDFGRPHHDCLYEWMVSNFEPNIGYWFPIITIILYRLFHCYNRKSSQHFSGYINNHGEVILYLTFGNHPKIFLVSWESCCYKPLGFPESYRQRYVERLKEEIFQRAVQNRSSAASFLGKDAERYHEWWMMVKIIYTYIYYIL